MTLRNALTAAAWSAAALGAALFAVRLSSAVSFSEPLHLITSGYEQQPLMGIWRAVHGVAVYADFLALPYYSGVYNWLFYEFYGAAVKTALAAFSLNDAWIPSAARLVTLAALAGCAVAAHRAYAVFSGAGDAPAKVLCAAFAVITAFGPLTGFWGFTARPDIFQLLFEIAAVLAFWNAGRRSLRAAAAAALLCYLAWAFKHSAVTVPAAVVVFCVLERRLRDAAVFSAVFAGLCAVTFAAASEHYLPGLLQAGRPFTLENAAGAALNAAKKSAPQIAGAAAFAAACLLRRNVLTAALKMPEIRFTGVLAAAASAYAAFLSAKEGSAENYYFLAAFALAAFALSGVRISEFRRTAAYALSAGFIVHIAALGMVLTGRAGVLSVADMHENNEAARLCMADLAPPVYAGEQYLQLPWMTPGTPLAFTDYVYPIRRAAGGQYEGGGVGGLIESGAFGSLYVGGAADAPIDGAALTGYVRNPQPCAGRWIYRRKAPP